MTTKTSVFTFTTGEHLINALVMECQALGIPPDDSALIQRLRKLHFQPQYPSAEMFVKREDKNEND